MIGLRFVALSALMPAAGSWLGATSVRRLPVLARVAFYFAGGLLTLSAVMFGFSVLGWAWSIPRVLFLPVLAGAIVRFTAKTQPPRENGAEKRRGRPAVDWALLALALLTIGILALAIAAGAATSFDLLFFWGAKGQRFALSHGIDTGFLRDPAHNLMHPDYPPLLPFYYAWSMLGGRQLDWWGAVFSAPLLLLLASCAVWGVASGQRHPHAAGLTALFACMFSTLFIQNAVGGNAEPMLLFFETLSLAALTLGESHVIGGALALAGCVLTKVEGTAFAVALILALVIVRPSRRTGRDLLWLIAVPGLMLAGWLVFCRAEHLIDIYRPSATVLTIAGVLSATKQVGKQASFGMWYLPWAVPALLIALGNLRSARVQLVTLCLTAGFLLYVYGRVGDQTILVDWSATRVLLSPLLMIFFAGVAATGRVKGEG
jgi:hypothetical protein